MPHFTFCFSRDGKQYVHSVAFKAESFGAAIDAVKAIDGVEPVSLRETPEWHWVVSFGFVLMIFMQVGLLMLVTTRGVWNLSSRTADSTTSWIIIGMIAFFLFMVLGASRMVRARHAKKAEQSLAELVAEVETPQPTFPALERIGWGWMRIAPIMMMVGVTAANGPQAVTAVLDASPEQLRGIQAVFLIAIFTSVAMSMIGSDTLWRGARKKSQAAG